MRNPIKTMIDWYIRSYHLGNYIKLDMIQTEIKLQLDLQKEQIIQEYDKKFDRYKQKLQADYAIKEAGYAATIQVLKDRDIERDKWHEKVIDLYYRVKGWAQELAVVSVQNQRQGIEIQNSIAEYVGKLDSIELNATSVTKEIDRKEVGDKRIIEG